MGRKIKKEKTKYTEKHILDILNKNFFNRNSIKYLMNNLFVFDWESDYLAITKSGIIHEIEVKISKSDFKRDFDKSEKHLILEGKNNNKILRPNYFYYAVPENLISIDEIPEYAGLIYIQDLFPYYMTIKKPIQLHTDKIDLNQLNLTDKFYYNMWQWKDRAENTYPLLIEQLKNEIKLSKIDENNVKYKYTLREANLLVESLSEDLEKYKKKIKDYENSFLDERRFNHKLMEILKSKNIEYKEIDDNL